MDNQRQVLAMRIKRSFREYQQPFSEYSIFKVPIQQRRENNDSYEPHMLAIGPFHRGIDRLQAMEVHKKIYLNELLDRMGVDIITLIDALKGLEKIARKSYAEHVSLDSDYFVEMMLLDGCFIIELLLKNCIKSLIKTDDLIFKGIWMIYSLKRDMLLLENQLPFFVLLEIYNLTKDSKHEKEILAEIEEQKQHQISIALRDMQEATVPLSEDGNMSPSLTSTKCLQHMIRNFFEEILPGSKFSEISNGHKHKHLLDFVHKSWHYPKVKEGKHEYSGHIRCATELQEAGISFRKSKNPNLFEITFQNGILEIPEIVIENRTESFLRNLIAYEQCSVYVIPIYIFDYVIVMDRLINSEKDVELLRRHRIIENTLGNDEVVAKMFNRMCNFVVISGEFRYLELFKKVNDHCDKTWNHRMAKLRHNYFNSPWALISFTAAVIILLLTFAQTNYSVLTYYHVDPK
ncbi:hypothetical protein ACFE04_011658 [Oxalis oulophora]